MNSHNRLNHSARFGVQVEHRRFQVVVSRDHLEIANKRTAVQAVSGEGMAQQIWRQPFELASAASTPDVVQRVNARSRAVSDCAGPDACHKKAVPEKENVTTYRDILLAVLDPVKYGGRTHYLGQFGLQTIDLLFQVCRPAKLLCI